MTERRLRKHRATRLVATVHPGSARCQAAGCTGRIERPAGRSPSSCTRGLPSDGPYWPMPMSPSAARRVKLAICPSDRPSSMLWRVPISR